MAYYTFGKKMMIFTGIYCYLSICLSLGDYILLIGDTLGFGLYNIHLCKYMWSFIGCILLIPLSQFRSLSELNWLCWLNVVSIVLSIAIALISLIY